jgi:cysteine desulfurase
VVGIAGFGKAIERTLEIRDREFRRVSALRDRLWRGIGRVFPKALLNGPTIGAARGRTARLPNNLNVFFGGVSAQEMLVRLDLLGVAASAGSACSARTAEPSYVVRALGYGEERARGSVRFTLGRMTTAQEIERAIGLMRKVSLGVVLGERKG